VKAESDFPPPGPGPNLPEDWMAFMTTSVGKASQAGSNGYFFEEPMDYWRGKFWFTSSPADDLRGKRLSVQTDEGCSYNDDIR
jgi:hypothetical protein